MNFLKKEKKKEVVWMFCLYYGMCLVLPHSCVFCFLFNGYDGRDLNIKTSVIIIPQVPLNCCFCPRPPPPLPPPQKKKSFLNYVNLIAISYYYLLFPNYYRNYLSHFSLSLSLSRTLKFKEKLLFLWLSWTASMYL